MLARLVKPQRSIDSNKLILLVEEASRKLTLFFLFFIIENEVKAD